jgi:hypothetical protein
VVATGVGEDVLTSGEVSTQVLLMRVGDDRALPSVVAVTAVVVLSEAIENEVDSMEVQTGVVLLTGVLTSVSGK